MTYFPENVNFFENGVFSESFDENLKKQIKDEFAYMNFNLFL